MIGGLGLDSPLSFEPAGQAPWIGLATLAESIDEPVILTDVSNTILYVNQAFERVTGYSAREAVGQKPHMLRSGLHGDDLYRDMKDALAQGNLWRGTLTNKKKDGSFFAWDALIFPLQDSAGRPAGFACVSCVRPGCRESYEHFRHREKIESLGWLVGSISHDYRNLAAAIMANAEMVLAEMDEKQPFRFEMEAIRDAAHRAASMSKQLLSFSQKTLLSRKATDLNTIVINTHDLFRSMMGKDVSVEMILAPDAGLIGADPLQIERVIMNLVLNARDAMPDGGRLTISTASLHIEEADVRRCQDLWPGPYARLTIADTGIGMDQRTLSRLFEPFFTTREAEKGTGLGLATVFGIVKQSGGHVSVSSHPGSGTTFTVYLPRLQNEASPAGDGHGDSMQPELALAT